VLNPVRQSDRALRHLSPQQKVDQAFDRFTTDYLLAQQVYFQSTGLSDSSQTFKDYTTQRVNVLGQELVQALVRLPGATTKLRANQRITPAMSTTLQSFLYRKINGNATVAPADNTSNGNVSLLTTLNSSVPPADAAISPAAATLFTLKASSAIDTARLNTINAASLMSSGRYNHHK
jgi:hypothetical protein